MRPRRCTLLARLYEQGTAVYIVQMGVGCRYKKDSTHADHHTNGADRASNDNVCADSQATSDVQRKGCNRLGMSRITSTTIENETCRDLQTSGRVNVNKPCLFMSRARLELVCYCTWQATIPVWGYCAYDRQRVHNSTFRLSRHCTRQLRRQEPFMSVWRSSRARLVLCTNLVGYCCMYEGTW